MILTGTVIDKSGQADSQTVELTVLEKLPLVFASDWGTATGTSVNACTDGNLWPVAINLDREDLEVVSASGLDFPSGMTNVLGIKAEFAGHSGIKLVDRFTELAIGETRYWRVYYRMAMNYDSGGTNQHQPQMAHEAGIIWFNFRPEPNGTQTFRQRWNMAYDRTPTDYFHIWEITTFSKDKTYRVEWSIERLATEFCKFRMQIYNSSDILEFDDTNIRCTRHNELMSDNIHDDEEPGANCRVLGSGEGGWQQTKHFMLVAQGKVWAGAGPNYYGGFAVSNVDWCGAYVPGEGS